MKKTYTVNIGGLVFSIDEDAFRKLNGYLDELKVHLKNNPGSSEIMEDIERRIAELFKEKLKDRKEVIGLDDVEKVVGILGKPGDIGEESEEDTQGEKIKRGMPKRLYRDIDDKMIGGVCSGLGYYINIDPTWVRIVFVVAILLSGVSAVAYLILWIVVPPANTITEKLEMRGNPVNLSNIENAVKEEMGNMKSKFDDFVDKTKDHFKKKE